MVDDRARRYYTKRHDRRASKATTVHSDGLLFKYNWVTLYVSLGQNSELHMNSQGHGRQQSQSWLVDMVDYISLKQQQHCYMTDIIRDMLDCSI